MAYELRAESAARAAVMNRLLGLVRFNQLVQQLISLQPETIVAETNVQTNEAG